METVISFYTHALKKLEAEWQQVQTNYFDLHKISSREFYTFRRDYTHKAVALRAAIDGRPVDTQMLRGDIFHRYRQPKESA